MKVTHKLNKAPLLRYQRALRTELGRAVRNTAYRVRNEARSNAPVDTGALRASLFVVSGGASGAEAAATRASSKAAFGGRSSFGMEMANPSGNSLVAFVVAGAHYAPFVEYGANGRPGVFFLSRSVNDSRGFLVQQIKEAHRRAAGKR